MKLPWETKKELRFEVELAWEMLGEACGEQIMLNDQHRAEIAVRDARIVELEKEGEAARLAMATHHCPKIPMIAPSGPRIRELERFIAAIAAHQPDSRVQVFATDLMMVEQGQMREFEVMDPRSWVIEYVPPRATSQPH